MVLVKIGHFSIFCVKVIQARKMCVTILQNGKTPFQAIKTRSSKKSKNGLFSKGVSPWFWSKIGNFSIFCFNLIQTRKMCFTILQNVKTPFQAIKTRSSKSEKIAIFPKGLVHGFGQKLSFFPNFFLRQYRRGNCVLRCSRTKKRRFRLRNKNLKKWNNCHFSTGVSPWFCSKIGHFSMFCFKALQTRKMCFTILTNEETPLQAIKTRSSKRGKIAIFPKGFVHGFGQKLAIFPNFF